MKTKTLPNAFKSRRVEEALGTLGEHIQYAISLTRLQPIQTSKSSLSGETLSPLPEVHKIEPGEIAHEDRQDIADRGIKVSGENLGKVQEVRLIRRHQVAPPIGLAHNITHSVDANGHRDGKSFTAHFGQLASLPPGSYKLLLKDDAGQTTLSPNAFTIRARVEHLPVPEKETELELGAILPNGSVENTTIPVALVILRGFPSEFYVTDLDDKRQKGWRVEKVTAKDVAERFEWTEFHSYAAQLQKLYGNDEIIFLTITIPGGLFGKDEFRRIYKLHAAATHPEGEDALAFFVRREVKTNR